MYLFIRVENFVWKVKIIIYTWPHFWQAHVKFYQSTISKFESKESWIRVVGQPRKVYCNNLLLNIIYTLSPFFTFHLLNRGENQRQYNPSGCVNNTRVLGGERLIEMLCIFRIYCLNIDFFLENLLTHWKGSLRRLHRKDGTLKGRAMLLQPNFLLTLIRPPTTKKIQSKTFFIQKL